MYSHSRKASPQPQPWRADVLEGKARMLESMGRDRRPPQAAGDRDRWIGCLPVASGYDICFVRRGARILILSTEDKRCHATVQSSPLGACARGGIKCVTNAIDRIEFNNATPNPAIFKNHQTHQCIFPMYSALLTPGTRKNDELF